jgi:hypothetical protein
LTSVAFWLTFYWLAGPITAHPRGVAEERPALPKVGVPSRAGANFVSLLRDQFVTTTGLPI